MRSSRSIIVRVFVLLLQVPFWMAPLEAQPSDVPAGLRRAEPITCQGLRQIKLRDRYIETSGDAVVVQGGCRVEIEGCHIVAGGIAVRVEGKSRVDVTGSYVEGGRAALYAAGVGRIEYADTVVRGAITAQGLAKIDGDDGAVASSSLPGASGGRIKIGAGGVRIESDAGDSITLGSDGVVLEDGNDEAAVRVSAGGIRLETDDAEVRVGAGGIRLGTDDASVAVDGDIRLLLDVSAPWRTAGNAYRSADTERLLVELGASVEAGQLSLNLAGDVLFDFSSAAIRPPAAAHLAKVAHLIRERSAGEIRVIGHTDSVGSDADNQKLSEERAIAVMRWLRDHEGIPVQIMLGRGMGSTKPIAHNVMPDGSDNPAGRARNRRVEIYFAVRP